MSDLSQYRRSLQQLRTSSPRRARSGGLTDYEQQLRPFIQEAQEGYDKEDQRIRPLQFILDFLQRGQYAAANVTEEIYDSIVTGEPLGKAALDTLRAGWQGLTGERKGDFEEVFFGETPEEERTFGQKAVGFLANVLLDPTTYISFGATKAATRAAAEFAKDSVIATVRNPAWLKTLGLAAKEASEESIVKAIGKIAKKDPIHRVLNDVYNRSFREALETGAEKGPEGLIASLDDIVQGGVGRGIDDLVKTAPQRYTGIGENKLGNFWGLNIGKRARNQMAPERWWNTARNVMRGTGEEGKVSGKLANAWWNVMQNPASPVAALRKMFGFLDTPYEKLGRQGSRRAMLSGEAATGRFQAIGRQIFGDMSKQQKDRLTTAISIAHDRLGPEDFADPGLEGKLDALIQEALGKGTDSDFLIGKARQMRVAFDEMRNVANEYASEGINAYTNEQFLYLPTMSLETTGKSRAAKRVGQHAPTPTFSKEKAFSERMAEEADFVVFAMGKPLREVALRQGVSPRAYAHQVIQQNNLGAIANDLEAMFMLRADIHGRMVSRGNLVREFREFGIREDFIKATLADNPGAAEKIINGSADLGLQKVEGVDALQGMLFDREIAKYMNRAVTAINTDEGISAMRDFFGFTTKLWKGAATMTPRFTIRNGIDGQMAGFIKHGPKWMNPKPQIDGWIATTYALHPEKYMDMLTEHFKAPDSWVSRRLNTPLRGTNMTLKEAADRAMNEGAISRRTMAFEPRTAKSREVFQNKVLNAPFALTRTVNDVVENHTKMVDFLINWGEMGYSDHAAQWAANSTKEWFFDYGDLTEFEKGINRYMAPFYTFVRKNVARHMSGIVLHHQMYQTLEKAKDAIVTEDVELELIPEWMEEMWYQPIKLGGSTQLIDPSLSMADLNKLPVYFEEGSIRPHFTMGEVRDDVLSSANPLVKGALTYLSGRDFFRKRDIEEYERAPELFQGLASSEPLQRAMEFIDGAIRIAGKDWEPLIKLEDDQVKMNGQLARQLEIQLPALRTLGVLITTPEAIQTLTSEDLEGLLDDVATSDDYPQALEVAFRWVGLMAGTRLRTYQEERLRQEKAEEVRREAEAEYREARKYVPGYQQRSARYWRDRAASNRRLGLYGS